MQRLKTRKGTGRAQVCGSGSPDLPPELTGLAFHIPTGSSGSPACWLQTVKLLQRPVPREKSLICHWLFLQRMWVSMLHGQGQPRMWHHPQGCKARTCLMRQDFQEHRMPLLVFFDWLAFKERLKEELSYSKRLSLAFSIRAQGQTVPMWSSSPQRSHREGVTRNYSRNEQADLLIQSEAASETENSQDSPRQLTHHPGDWAGLWRLWDQPELSTYLNKPKWEEFPRNYSILIKSFEKYLKMVSIYLLFVCATLRMPEEPRKGSQTTAAAVTGGGWRPNVSPTRTASNLNCWSISPGPEISLEKDFDLPLLKI